MNISYKKLWKLLIDKDMNKTDLRLAIGVSTAIIARLSKGEPVTMDVLLKICKVLGCDISDIMKLKPSMATDVTIERFPSDFMFQLTDGEMSELTALQGC